MEDFGEYLSSLRKRHSARHLFLGLDSESGKNRVALPHSCKDIYFAVTVRSGNLDIRRRSIQYARNKSAE
jgi:hypothetical protein